MIHPRPGPIGLNSISTIETKERMATASEEMLAIKMEESEDLNLHLKTKEEEKKAEKEKHEGSTSIPAIALELIRDLQIAPLHNKTSVYVGSTIDYVV